VELKNFAANNGEIYWYMRLMLDLIQVTFEEEKVEVVISQS